MLRLYDTATGSESSLRGDDEGRIGLYVCGPTVYGPPHIGHGRFALTYDILRRYLESTGVEVRHVSNVTDIDDKIINLANAEHRSSHEVAVEYEAMWWEAMDTLGVAKPTVAPHATDFVAQMIEMIAELIGRGVAYETSDGVYLEVAKVAGYGLLAQQSLDSLRAGSRVEVNDEKRAPFDFALWKSAKAGEPAWEAPFGVGRPGWHTECVVMALELLGEGFSLHGGGADLKFPHNENERAQAVALGRSYARHWMHNGTVMQAGEKMSKSIGNVVDLASLADTHDRRAYRLVVLQSHYRAPSELGSGNLEAAEEALRRIDALARRLDEAGSLEVAGPAAASEAGDAVTKEFRTHMDNDLSTPQAIASLFAAVTAANSALDRGDGAGGAARGRAALRGFEAVGILAAGATSVPDEIVQMARHRDEARGARDWAAADRLRSEIEAAGYRVEDTPGGTRVYR
ncbi:MAG: cysteine--tRNA ligase [Acidimicrobiales bacterium]